MKTNILNHLAILSLLIVCATSLSISALAAPAPVDSIFSTKEILDESTLEAKTLHDWHIDTKTGSTRQKLVEIKKFVAEVVSKIGGIWLPRGER